MKRKTIFFPQSNDLLCSFVNSSQVPCKELAQATATYKVKTYEGYVDEVQRKFCEPHATKFSIIFAGNVSFRRIPMPRLKRK